MSALKEEKRKRKKKERKKERKKKVMSVLVWTVATKKMNLRWIEEDKERKKVETWTITEKKINSICFISRIFFLIRKTDRIWNHNLSCINLSLAHLN